MTGMSTLPTTLVQRIEEAGYYPAFVADVLDIAVAGEPVTHHLVHGETTFDEESIRRHLSVLVLTATRLIFVHADDHGGDDDHLAQSHGVATSEAVPLGTIRTVMLTHVVPSPAQYRPGALGREMTLTIGWGAVSRVDLESAACGDPNCDADHGYTGTMTGDDLALRVSADAEGDHALRDAIEFTRALSAATASHSSRR
ncbi:phosphodiesterase [Nakamurella silvestris]|nr:phosphodiesterase [Nakamurella silvestris]